MAITNNSDAGTVTKKVVKTSAGTVYGAIVTSVSASLRWFQLHDKASAPAGADVPSLWFPLPAGSATQPAVLILDQEFFMGGEPFTTGVSWAISTTIGTFTDSATANEHTVIVKVQ